MEIIIEPHTLIRAKERGAEKEEIIDVINNGQEIQGKYNRIGKSKIYVFGKKWLDCYYKEKKVDVFYAVENNKIFTVTVYVFYGEW